MKKNLYIIGAGGFGREVAWLVERINENNPTWDLKGFIDDDEALWGTYEDEYPVLGGCDFLLDKAEISDLFAVCAVGAAQTRKKIIDKLDGKVSFATIIDPSVIISKRVEIGDGSIICAGTIITVDIKIGNHVIINLDCTLGHDDIVHDFVTIYPSANISGNVEIGECSELGTGMKIIQGKKITAGSIIGAGAVIVKDIDKTGMYVGIPAKAIK